MKNEETVFPMSQESTDGVLLDDVPGTTVRDQGDTRYKWVTLAIST